MRFQLVIYFLILSIVIYSESVFSQVKNINQTNELKLIERIEVVGSRIKRIAKERSEATIDIKSDLLKKSPNISIGDILRDTPSSIEGVAPSFEAPRTVANLNGLGPSKTLVLLNGHRLPPDPAFDSVDLNSIPASAVERIEILKGGSAALYGSDALGGVINIITKKDINYSELILKYFSPEKPGGQSLDISGVTGLSNEIHSLTLALSYSKNSKILGKDRESTRNGLSPVGLAPAWTDGANPYVVENSSECDPSLLQTDDSGQRCYYRYKEENAVRPGSDQLNLFSDYSYRLPSNFKIYNRNTVMYRETHLLYSPQSLNLSLTSGTSSKPSARKISYRELEAGNRISKMAEFDFNSLIGIKGNITSDLELDTTISYGEINQFSRDTSGYFSTTRLKELIASGTYDPLAPIGSRGDFSAALFNNAFDEKQRLLNFESILSGDLFTYEDRTVGFAGGLSFMADRQKIFSGKYNDEGSSELGYRTISAVFTELNFPLTSKLELNGAARLDQYSDFGTTINPRLSTKYNLSEEIMLRSSIGTGFKAPRFFTLHMPISYGSARFIDRKLCQADPTRCKVDDYDYDFIGNPDLKEEKSISASVGTVIQPTNNFSISIDGWYTTVKNIIDIDYEDITRAEANGVNPSDYGVTVTRDVTGKITNISYKMLNLASEEISGLDFNLQYTLPQTLWGSHLEFENDYSYKMFDKYEGFPGAGKTNIMGNWGKPYWKNMATFKIKNDISEFKISFRSLPGQNVYDRYVDRKISDSNEWDLFYSRFLDSKCQFSVGIKNIMNAAQPVDWGSDFGGANMINESLYDFNGRRFFATYTEKF